MNTRNRQSANHETQLEGGGVAGLAAGLAAGFFAGFFAGVAGATVGQTGAGAAAGTAFNEACRSTTRFSPASAPSCIRSASARRPASRLVSASVSAAASCAGADNRPTALTRSTTSYSASTFRYAGNTFTTESGAASAAASNPGSVPSTSRLIDARFAVVSSFTGPAAFHLSTFTAANAAFTASIPGCISAEGLSATAGALAAAGAAAGTCAHKTPPHTTFSKTAETLNRITVSLIEDLFKAKSKSTSSISDKAVKLLTANIPAGQIIGCRNPAIAQQPQPYPR
jgi:hypothetical protein